MTDHSSILREAWQSQGQIGIAWYRPEQWARLLEIAADRDKLDARYEDWLVSAQRVLVRLNAEGTPARRVEVDVEQLREWCQAKSRPVDAAARSEFVAFTLQQRYEAGRGATDV